LEFRRVLFRSSDRRRPRRRSGDTARHPRAGSVAAHRPRPRRRARRSPSHRPRARRGSRCRSRRLRCVGASGGRGARTSSHPEHGSRPRRRGGDTARGGRRHRRRGRGAVRSLVYGGAVRPMVYGGAVRPLVYGGAVYHMNLNRYSLEYVFVPVSGPDVIGELTHEVAIVEAKTEVASGDWKQATWDADQGAARVLVRASAEAFAGAADFTFVRGSYVVWWRVTSGPEVPARFAGKIKVA